MRGCSHPERCGTGKALHTRSGSEIPGNLVKKSSSSTIYNFFRVAPLIMKIGTKQGTIELWNIYPAAFSDSRISWFLATRVGFRNWAKCQKSCQKCFWQCFWHFARFRHFGQNPSQKPRNTGIWKLPRIYVPQFNCPLPRANFRDQRSNPEKPISERLLRIRAL